MKDKDFKQLCESIREMGKIIRGEMMPGRVTTYKRGKRLVTEYLELPRFVKRLMKCKSLRLAEKDVVRKRFGKPYPVQVAASRYGGSRTDRLRDGNVVTNALGFPRCDGRYFMVARMSGVEGMFLADILAYYGEDYWFYDGDVRLDFSHDVSYSGSYMGISPRKAWKPIAKAKGKTPRVQDVRAHRPPSR